MNLRVILILFLILFTNLSWAYDVSDYVVVVSDKNPVQKISVSQLKRYFYKERGFWEDSRQAIPFDLQEDNLRNAFHKKFFNKSPKEMSRYWAEQKFTTGRTYPRRVKVRYLGNMVKVFSGGLGYLPRGYIKENEIEGIKVLEVTGIKKGPK